MARSKDGKHPAKKPLTRWQKRVLARVEPGRTEPLRDKQQARDIVAEGLAEPEAVFALCKKLGKEITPEQAVRVSALMKEMAR